MFSLRKRAKLDQKRQVEAKRILSFPTSFEELPVEVYYHIFDYLSVEELLSLRLLNVSFKNIIDNATHIWTKIVLKYRLNNSETFWNLFNTKSNLNCIRLENEHVIRNKRYRNELAISLSCQTSKLFQLDIKCDPESLCILNLFAKNCHTIDLQLLYGSKDIKTSKQMEYLNRQVDTFEQLKSARLEFKGLIDSSELFVKTHFRSMLKNVAKLDLEGYNGSGKILLKSLRALKGLDELKIRNFWINDELKRDEFKSYESLIKNNDFSIRVLKIEQSSFKSAMAFLLSVTEVIQLDLFAHESRATHFATKAYYSQVEIYQMSEQICTFKNLKKLKTNFVYFGVGLHLNLPQSLSELELMNRVEDSYNAKHTIYNLDSYCKTSLFGFNQFERLFTSQTTRYLFEKIKILFKFDCHIYSSHRVFTSLLEKVSFKYLHIIFKCTNLECLRVGNSSKCRFDKLLTRHNCALKVNNYVFLKNFYLNNLEISSNLSQIDDSCFIRTDYINTEIHKDYKIPVGFRNHY